MKRPTMLACCVLNELSMQHSLSAERDVEVIQRRVEHEGLSFLTITLPLFSDVLEKGIENGFVTRESWGGYFRLIPRGCLPAFLQGFTTKVFSKSGELLSEPDADAIFALRQICRLFKKTKIPCSRLRNRDAMDKFVSVEAELRAGLDDVWISDPYLDKVAGILWSEVFPEITPDDLICRHGPGSTAEHKTPNGRLLIDKWYDRSELTFPSDLHIVPSLGHVQYLESVKYLSVKDELPVRVVFVPKTLRSPRVIAIEPSHVQYMQQGLMGYVVPRLENHPLTRASIHFTDQRINQDAARRASIDRQYATIDLKDASDRVHLELVRRIFSKSSLLEYLEDSRSLYARLPDGREVILSKFASMGSAMCFPVEAMVFYTLIQAAVHSHLGIRPTSRSVRTISKYVHVYGDDIIVPVAWADCVMSKLEAYLLRVNRDKSFTLSHFRESCGGDFFNGYAVKPVYIREVPHDDITTWTPPVIMSLAKTSDQFYELGLWKTCQLIRDWIEFRYGPVPRAPTESGGLQFKSVTYNGLSVTYSIASQAFRQKRVRFRSRKKPDRITHEVAFLNKALNRPRTSLLDMLHGKSDEGPLDLEFSVNRGKFKQDYHWVTVR